MPHDPRTRIGQGEGPRNWLSDSALPKLIKRIHAETKAAYDSRRVFQEIKARGHPVDEGRVERLMRERMTEDLVIDALRMAWFRRRPKPRLIFHPDRGSSLPRH